MILTSLYVPANWNVNILKSRYTSSYRLYLLNDTYRFVIPLIVDSSKLSWCSSTRNLIIKGSTSTHHFPMYINSLSILLYSFSRPLFRKIKFKGKGYYIYKNHRNTVAPQFGFSHRIYIYNFYNSVKFIGKTCVILFGLNKQDVINSSIDIRRQRYINVFTGRGVRFARQVVYRKPGKVSSYK